MINRPNYFPFDGAETMTLGTLKPMELQSKAPIKIPEPTGQIIKAMVPVPGDQRSLYKSMELFSLCQTNGVEIRGNIRFIRYYKKRNETRIYFGSIVEL